jgi:hypothetical protein
MEFKANSVSALVLRIEICGFCGKEISNGADRKTTSKNVNQKLI